MEKHTPFKELVVLCQNLESTPKKREKTQFIQEFLHRLKAVEISPSVLLILGMVFPDTDARALNVSESTIRKVVSRLQRKTRHPKPLNILEVHNTFCEIATTSGRGARQKREELLESLFLCVTRVEAEYLVRIIFGEMRLGVAKGVMIQAVAQVGGVSLKLAQRASMFIGDIGELARIAVTRGKEGLSEIGLQLFQPIEPMLAELAKGFDTHCTQPTAFEQVFTEHSGKTVLEYKYDGARVQIHKQSDKVAIFSRQLSDVTESLPEIVNLTKEMVKADEAILDGEVVAFGEGGKPLPFQDLMRRFSRVHHIDRVMKEVPIKLHLFDLMYLDGKSLIDAPYEQRWSLLAETCGRACLADQIITDNPSEAESFLNQAMELGHEGLMAKSLQSDYAPGARGKKWFKIKPAETLDVVITAGEWGHGRRQGWLSNYHLAVRDSESDQYWMIGKTFKGLTDGEFIEMTQQLQTLKISEDPGTVYVKPKIVVEVAYNEIQKSPHYKSGFALRFARITNIRHDMNPQQVDTIGRLQQLYAKQFERKAKAKWS